MLDNKELKDFKMDINEYIQYGMENELDQRWMKELENASAKHHIEKLTALKMQVEAEYQKVFAKEEQVVSDTIKEAYKDRYYRTAYEIESAFKLKNTIGTINEKKLNNIINKPWAADGSNFSDRIWIKKDQMVDSLYKEMVRNLIQGESLKDTIANMTKFVDSSNKNAKYCAARLIQTESAYFASKSQYECYNDLDVEEYEIVATLDNHTSDICQRMNGQHFKMSEYEPGVTAPPFHVFCRSTTCPYFNDEFSYGSRAARGIDGKTYDVDSKLTYKEWYAKFKEEADKKEREEKVKEFKEKYSKIISINKWTDDQIYAIIKNNRRFGLLKSYDTAINNDYLQKTVLFNAYEKVNSEAREKIIGQITSNDIEITDIRNHITERIIGNGTGSRLPFKIDNIIKCLKDKNAKIKINSRMQTVIVNKKGQITISKDGIIVTVVSKE